MEMGVQQHVLLKLGMDVRELFWQLQHVLQYVEMAYGLKGRKDAMTMILIMTTDVVPHALLKMVGHALKQMELPLHVRLLVVMES